MGHNFGIDNRRERKLLEKIKSKVATQRRQVGETVRSYLRRTEGIRLRIPRNGLQNTCMCGVKVYGNSETIGPNKYN